MTSVFTWRDQSGAPACVVKNALTQEGCDNLVKELSKQTYQQGKHIQDDGKVVTLMKLENLKLFGLMIWI